MDEQRSNQSIQSEVTMSKLMTVILLAAILPSAVAAQSKEHRGQGYVFIAPTSTSGGTAGLHFGVGGEGLVYKGLGVGGEIGYLGVGRDLSQRAGIFSPNVSYNFLRSKKVSPFLTGGYSLVASGSGAGNAVNLGGGIHWWFKEHIGLRFEFRDHFPPGEPQFHIIGVRFGLAFR
jgi:hypothetical protein